MCQIYDKTSKRGNCIKSEKGIWAAKVWYSKASFLDSAVQRIFSSLSDIHYLVHRISIFCHCSLNHVSCHTFLGMLMISLRRQHGVIYSEVIEASVKILRMQASDYHFPRTELAGSVSLSATRIFILHEALPRLTFIPSISVLAYWYGRQDGEYSGRNGEASG